MILSELLLIRKAILRETSLQESAQALELICREIWFKTHDIVTGKLIENETRQENRNIKNGNNN